MSGLLLGLQYAQAFVVLLDKSVLQYISACKALLARKDLGRGDMYGVRRETESTDWKRT